MGAIISVTPALQAGQVMQHLAEPPSWCWGWLRLALPCAAASEGASA